MKASGREEKLKEKLCLMRKYEEAIYKQGLSYIAGVDEVGRGPLAGPVVSACVILPKDFNVLGVDDSKKLSEKKRKELAKIIKQEALAYGIGKADEKVIDKINILQATKGSMMVAVNEAEKMLLKRENEKISYILFDAMEIKEIETPQKNITRGDSKSVSIAAASILAKVTRDEMMIRYNEIYPGYSFDSNKGYGTKAHYEGLKNIGRCPIHRDSFLKSMK